ncbi:maleylpyruvate isomerase family mycothiol-dependent enzyme [Arthrobacter sp. HY1533]|uniref:maleylpyruvate isomerase family mycothiol-dependent enzyme n=1 Tax=Arthrobacter sp. HY1533 TaxID=2970919 RepID=UPI0022BA0BE3|nr:maleylpyruvate isomerase family mycothiol-dependent enzyme [Arthrobacter sp. HY1533]
METATAPVERSTSADAYTTVMTALADELEALSPEQWRLPTECTGWSVRDMAGHLLGAQEDLLRIRTVLRRRARGRRRYPHLSLLDAANQVQVQDHAALGTAELCRQYRANIPQVSRRVRRFPGILAGVPVQKGMAPANSALRLGYLFNVIYLRDAWMHGADLARATGNPRRATAADGLLLAHVLRDLATEWGGGDAVELVLPGEPGATVGLGGLAEGRLPVARLEAPALELCRSLSGRVPESGITTVAGDPEQARRLAAVRILF